MQEGVAFFVLKVLYKILGEFGEMGKDSRFGGGMQEGRRG